MFSLYLMEAFVNNTVKTILGLFVAVILLAGAFSGGFIAGQQAMADYISLPMLTRRQSSGS